MLYANMRSASRKFYVWLICLGAVFVIYLLYSRISETPHIEIDTAAEPALPVADGNAGMSDSEIGMVGDVGVGTVRKARFTDLDRQKQLEREFGFEKLLHQRGDEWEIEKPYMNIFRPNLKCYITADRANVRVETTAGRHSPKDAALAGNVVIHILPEKSSGLAESFIYLDDVIFVSEESQFSTAGPVKFISHDAQMLGQGMELVYNNELDRLEFLRIIHLETLRLKTSSSAPLFSPASTHVTDVPQKKQPSSERGLQITERGDGEYYRCVFSKNVVIDGPEQLVFADEISINNIIQTRAPSEKSSGVDTVSANRAGTGAATVESGQELVDIVVTCDGGVLITPMDFPEAAKSPAELDTDVTVTGGRGLKNFGDTGGRDTFIARKIDYCAVTEQVVLEGNCLCTVLRPDANTLQKYTLSAPKVTVDLARGTAEQPYALAAGIRRLVAIGGGVKLARVETAAEKLLGGIELKCATFDYDGSRQLVLATGPGLIKIDNSNISQRREEPGPDKFSSQKRCYALLRNFDTLEYFLRKNRIITDNKRQAMLIDYFPIVRGRYGQQVAATAGRIEAVLYQPAGGRNELASIGATGGVTYEEANTQFEGSELFCDLGSSVMTVRGDDAQPCYFNGALVDAIEYDLKTGAVNAEIAAPGALRMGR